MSRNRSLAVPSVAPSAILDRVGETSVLPDFGSEIATTIVSPSTFQRAVG